MVTRLLVPSLIPNLLEFMSCTKLQRSQLIHLSPQKMSTTKDDCIFCKICKKEAPADLVYEDEDVLIFKDIKPSTKFHYLAIPKQHIKTAKDLKLDQKHVLENLVAKGMAALEQNGADVNDVRMGFHWPPFNSISHLHLHVISPVAEMNFISRQIFKPNTWWFVTMSSADADCIFCKICRKEAPADLLYEDDDVLIFKDIKPSTRFHYLAIPKQHIDTVEDLKPDQTQLLEKLIAKGMTALEQNGADINDVLMGFHWPPFITVSHLHLHVISAVADMNFISREEFDPTTWWFVTADYVLEQLNTTL